MTAISPTSQHRAEFRIRRHIAGLCRLLLGLQIACCVLVAGGWILAVMGLPLDPDYAAGELLDHATAWATGSALYPTLEHAPFRVLNYPPAFLGICVALYKAGLPLLLAGRLISIFSAAITISLCFAWMRRRGISIGMALAGVTALGGASCVIYFAGQFHLQWTAVCASVAGLYVLQRARRWWEICLAGALCALACFFKQTQVATAVIAGLWSIKVLGGRALWFFGALFAVGTLGAIALEASFGDQVRIHLTTYTIGTFSVFQLGRVLREGLVPWSLFAGIGLWLGLRNGGRRGDLRWWYFLGTTVGLLSCARMGSSLQYFIEWSVATVLWVFPELRDALSGLPSPQKTFVAVAVLGQIAYADGATVDFLVDRYGAIRRESLLLPRICAALPESRALVLVEEAAVARACGRQTALHPFIMANLSARHLWSEDSFVGSLERGDYPVLLLPFDPRYAEGVHAERWTPRMLAAIVASYHVQSSVGEWRVLIPNVRSPSPARTQ